ncbi:MAG: 2-hydroxyacyl-CoA dehydratase family protein [Desulfarculaceae bacterium]|nr:2-hydroxyacyl-CoA dehydratase family protein [Desulfarculaceae bacterium]MCF8071199.1 2-hydroxyacyl-CoA dehydratase family protein [Desulfarculaceae bacterium]MCF8101198.1 2-hydroxyacyl-CoA dehydratase family protein [Desulfarculaceae bacterium]MCF8115253.1 2-hydroxyacyl-CoA dehydratase family protein [Desulfarculaceae bacterium]
MKSNSNMEDQLRVLLQANQPANRASWAAVAKEQGQKVLGLLCIYVPEEIVAAAGVLPWRITGSWEESTPHASFYRPEMTCRYCSHVLESVLAGELDFLDGVATTQVDDDFKRLWDVLSYVGKPPFAHIMYLPHTVSRTTLAMWNKSVLDLVPVMEDFAGVKIGEQDILKQIEIYNEMRSLLYSVYQMRKKTNPPLTGAEMLSLTTAARVMPKPEFNQRLESLLPYLETRQPELKGNQSRLLLCGEYLDNPEYVRVVENSGALVVMDELDTGSKYFMGMVDASQGDALGQLAERYMNRPGLSRMGDWRGQAEQIISWVKEYDVQGVVELRQLYSLPLDYRAFYLGNLLQEAGIPYLTLNREYHPSHMGMLSTRVEAFVEMIQ